MYDAKLSSRSVIHDSAGFAGRAMAEDLENPEDKVRDNTISVRRSKQFMRTVTAPARSPRRTSHLMGSDKPVTTLEWWKDEDLAAHFTRDEPLENQERAERRGPRWRAPCGRTGGDGGRGGAGNADM